MLTITDSLVSKMVSREFAEEKFERVVGLLSLYCFTGMEQLSALELEQVKSDDRRQIENWTAYKA